LRCHLANWLLLLRYRLNIHIPDSILTLNSKFIRKLFNFHHLFPKIFPAHAFSPIRCYFVNIIHIYACTYVIHSVYHLKLYILMIYPSPFQVFFFTFFFFFFISLQPQLLSLLSSFHLLTPNLTQNSPTSKLFSSNLSPKNFNLTHSPNFFCLTPFPLTPFPSTLPV